MGEQRVKRAVKRQEAGSPEFEESQRSTPTAEPTMSTNGGSKTIEQGHDDTRDPARRRQVRRARRIDRIDADRAHRRSVEKHRGVENAVSPRVCDPAGGPDRVDHRLSCSAAEVHRACSADRRRRAEARRGGRRARTMPRSNRQCCTDSGDWR
jgi:hypothetical protein